MAKSTNDYHTQLLEQIEVLKRERKTQEHEIKTQYKDIIDNLDPVAVLKQSIVTLTADNEIKIDVARLAINLGTNYAIDTFFNKNNSVKDYLLSMITNRFPNSFITKIIKQFQ